MHCLRQVLHSGKRVAITILSHCVTVLYTELLSSRLHLPYLPTKCTWCISSHHKRRLSLVSSSTSPYLEYIKPPQAPPFFSLHLPHLPTWCISSHLKRHLSSVFIIHISLLGVSQATSSATFLQSSSSTSPYLEYLKPPQAPPFFSLHPPHLPTWCISSHIKRLLSLVFIFHISLLGVSQATSSATFLQSSSSTSPNLVYIKPPQAPLVFSLHLPHLPTWSISSHLKRHFSLVFIFHISLLGVSQATSSATFLQSSSSTSPYLEYLKPHQVPPFFSLHLPHLPTWCISSHLKRHLYLVCIFHISLLGVSQATSIATFLQSSSSTSPYSVYPKPPQVPPFCSLHLPYLPTWSISSDLKRHLSLVFIFHISLLGVSQATSSATFLQSSSSTSPYLEYLKPPQAPPFFSLHLPHLPTWSISSHLKRHLSLVFIFHIYLKPPQAPHFFSLHLPHLPTWCISSHLKRHLSSVFIIHISLLVVSQATSSATFLQSSSSTSPYLEYLKPPQAPPFFSLHLPHLPTWSISSHIKRHLSLVFIFHISLLGVSQATSSATFLQSSSSTSPYLVYLKPPQAPPFIQSSSSTSPYLVYLKPPQAPLLFSFHLPHLPTWSISSHLKRRLSVVFIFHISLLGVSQATSSATFLQSSSSTSPYLVYLKPPQAPPFFSLQLATSPYLEYLKPPQAPPFFSLHLPPLPTQCISSHIKCHLSLVFIFHISLLGVYQATSSAIFLQCLHLAPLPPQARLEYLKPPPQAHLSLVTCTFLQSSSSTSPYLVYLKPHQVPPFFSLHLPHLPTWCISSHLKRHLSFVFILHLSLPGVSQATSSATFIQSSSSTSPYLVSLKPPQAPPFFSLHLPHLPTWCISSHIKRHLYLVFIFHISLLGVSQATSSATFLQSSSSTSPYLVYLKPHQVPPFFSLHLPHLPTWSISSHLMRHLSLVFIFRISLLSVYQPTSSATFLQSSSSSSPYLVYIKPHQLPPFFSLHLPHLPTWCISSHINRHISLVFIFRISLLSVYQATSSATFLQSSSSTSPYLVYINPHQVPPFFSLHLPHLPTQCISTHIKCHLSLVFIFLISLLSVYQATSCATFLQSSSSASPYLVYINPHQVPPFFSLHLAPLPTWCLSSHIKCHLSLVFIFLISLLSVYQATSCATFLQSSSSASPYLVYINPHQVPPFFSLHLPHLPTQCISTHIKCHLSLVFIFLISLLSVYQATSCAIFLQSSSSASPYLVYIKPPQAPPFFSLHLPHLPTWCLSSHIKCHLSLVVIFHISLLSVYQATSSATFLQSSSSTSPYLVYIKPHQAPSFFTLHLPHLPTQCISSHIKRHLSLVFIFLISLLSVYQATSSATFLQSSSSSSPYLVYIKPHQAPPFFSLHLPHLPTQCISSATFLQSSSSSSPYLVYLKPHQVPPFFSLHLPHLPTQCISSHIKRHLSLVFIFLISLLSVYQATSSATFLQSSSSSSPYLVYIKPHQAPPFFSLHLPHLPTWCISSHIKCHLSLVFIFLISLLSVYQATSSATFLQSSSSSSPYLVYIKPHQVPPFFSLHLPHLPTWCISSHLKRRVSLVFIFLISLLSVYQATSSATFLQSSSSSSPYLVYIKPHQAPPFFSLHLPHLPTQCISSHIKRHLSLVFIFHISLLSVYQATSSATFLQSSSSSSPYLVYIKPHQAPPFFSLHLPHLPT